jgi:hypothetical protein
LHTALAEVVPDLDRLVASGDEVGLVCAWVEIDVVDAFVVCVHGEVGAASAEGPHFDGAIEAGGGEGVGVFGVEGEVHDIVGVAFVHLEHVGYRMQLWLYDAYLDILPSLLPVSCLDCHIVTSR